MDTLQKLLEAKIAKLVAEGKITEHQIEDAVPEALKGMIPGVAGVMSKTLKRNAPEMLKERRAIFAGFRRRHRKRWRKAFDLLDTIYVICEEAGAEFNEEIRPLASKNNDPLFEALVTLHSRALLTSNEILWLLNGGFPDGALGRWRAVHEIAVTALFLLDHGTNTAERYLMSLYIAAHRAMRQYQLYADTANLEPYTDEQLKGAQHDYDSVISRYGDSMKYEYGWASEALNNKKPTFRDIEKKVQLDHWRPRYSWASQYAHANYKPPMTYLGLAEATEDVLLVGPSDAGLTDPAHMMALSLIQATIALLLLEPNLDRLVILKVVLCFWDDLGEILLQIDHAVKEKHGKSNPQK